MPEIIINFINKKNMETNRFFYKKAEKGWAIMKRRVDGYIVFIQWVASWQEARQQVYKLNGWS